jgi:hypothetical protein
LKLASMQAPALITRAIDSQKKIREAEGLGNGLDN